MSPKFKQELEEELKYLYKAIEEDDDEVAHSTEDSVHILFIKEIARTSSDSDTRNAAQQILDLQKLKFHRWCA